MKRDESEKRNETDEKSLKFPIKVLMLTRKRGKTCARREMLLDLYEIHKKM